MKKTNFILTTIAAILLFAAPALAWWHANAQVRVNHTYVGAAVSNNLPRSIYCQGYVYGQTYYGQTLRNRVSGVIYPGQYAYWYVYTNRSNPFVNGWANVQCRTR